MRQVIAVLGFALTCAYGCDANHVLGTYPDAALANQGGSAGASGPARDAGGVILDAPTSAPEVGPLGPSQSWTGYIENATFRSGSDSFKLTFAADANGNIAGTAIFGQGTPPPPATDPNMTYPPGAAYIGNIISPMGLTEGFTYPIEQGTFTTQRLRVQINLAELYASWCALQTGASVVNGGCAPSNWAGRANGNSLCQLQNPTTKQWVTINCVKFSLCSFYGPCACGAATCSASTMSTLGQVSLDIALDGDTGAGAIMGTGTQASYAHLTKD
ncbi:MAG TPA: hypothetical protein VH560_14740, partial [Polyangia bacterium]|nr:hypothetical protein [Polyangia bacterium]